MDPRAHLLDLLTPLRPGDEIATGARLLGVSAEVGFWLRFDLRGAEVSVEVAPLGDAKFAVRTKRHGISYRSEGGRKTIDPKIGLALCRAVADRVARNEDRVAASMARAADDTTVTATRVREVRVDTLLELATFGADRFYKLSTYTGCLIGCRYCYAQTPLTVLRRIERLPEVPWGSYVDVRVNAAEVLAAELATLPPAPIKLCPILSDPYQAVEARYGVTRACLEMIRDAPGVWPTLLLTRSKLVTRDTDLIASLPAVWAGASIPTIDDETRRHFEPRAASIPERLEALATLRAAGARTFAVVQPLLTGSIEALADALAETVSSVSIDVLRGEEQAGADFDDPRHAEARTEAWQKARAAELTEALEERGVAVWPGEFPPELIAMRG
ncbi:Radical SAM domain protein [Minicystis rosea]|nr:Radical SAM domain protein [Minicystis rosea]